MKRRTRLLLENAATWIVAVLLFVAMCLAMAGCEQAPQRQTTILAFTAKWCVACKADGDCIEMNRLAGVRIVEIDVDSHSDLVAKYGIVAIPTYVVLLPNGGVVAVNDVDKAVSYVAKRTQ